MEARELKDRAADAFARGRFARAAQLYENFCRMEPADGQARLRLGDALVRAGEKGQAIEAYLAAAELFAREGFLPRAIAASKLVLELDPTQTSVQQMLAGLYARRRAATGPRLAVARPAAKDAARPALKAPTPPPVAALAPPAVEAAPEGEPSIEIELDLGDEAPAPVARPSRIFVPGGPEAGLPPEPLPEIPAGMKPRRDIQAGLQAFSRFSELELDFDVLVRTSPRPDDRNALSRPSPGLIAPAIAPMEAPAPEPLPEPVPAGVAGAEVGASADPVDAGGELDFGGVDGGFDAPEEPVPEARPRRRFSEMEFDDTSLLNTIAAVAEAVAAEQGLQEEETVFTLSDAIEGEDEALPAGELPHIPLFSDLPPEAFIELFERCPLRRLRSGQRIVQQGSYGDAFYVICEGSVAVTRDDHGQTRQLAVLESGEFFGEVALLSDAPRTASVDSASDETQLLEISAPVLTELSHRYPTVAKALKKFCRERLLRTLVSSSELFRTFGKGSRRKLLERFRARDVQRGHVFVSEGTESDGLYVLLSGEVSVVRDGQELARLKEGEIFGEMSLLQKTPATATVSATRRTSILRLPRTDFDALILTHPQALMHLAELSDARRKHTAALIGGGEGGEGKLLLV